MKGFFSILVLILSCSFSFLYGADVEIAEEIFKKGNDAYASGDFDTAILHYEEALEHGVSAPIYYNLGNAYFKKQEIPSAILQYERALRYDPKHTNARANLELANSLTADKIDPLPKMEIAVWWQRFVRAQGPDFWAWLAIGLITVGVIFFFLYFFSRSSGLRKLGFFVGLILIITSVISAQLSFTAKKSILETSEAVIFEPKIDVKSAPGESGKTVFILHEGTKVKILNEENDWLEISIASGNVGWIKKNTCEII